MSILKKIIDIRPLERAELYRLHDFPFSKEEGRKPYLARGAYIDQKGRRRNWKERRIYMIKTLIDAKSPS